MLLQRARVAPFTSEVAPALIPFVALLLLPAIEVLVPGSIGWDSLTYYDWQRIGLLTSLVACLLSSLALARYGGTTRLALGGRPDWVAACVLLSGSLSIVTNDIPWADALHEIVMIASLAACFGVVSHGLRRTPRGIWERPVQLCLSGSAWLYLTFFFSENYDNLFTPMYMGAGVTYSVFSNVRFFSDYQALLIPFLIYLIPPGRPTFETTPAWFVACAICMLFFFTGSRVLVLGQLGAHMSLLLLLRKRYLPTLRRHVQVWVGAYLLFLVLTVCVPYLLAAPGPASLPLIREGLSLRDLLWAIALKDAISHPWLGIGPGEFARQLNPVAAGPHNSVLMAAAEWGIPAMVLMLILFFRFSADALRRISKKAPRDSSLDISIAAWLAFGALSLHSLVANVLVVPSSQLAFLLSACLLSATTVASRNHAEDADLNLGSRNASLIHGAIKLLLCGTLMAILAYDVPRLPTRNQDYLHCGIPTHFFSPRFWQQGWLADGCANTSS